MPGDRKTLVLCKTRERRPFSIWVARKEKCILRVYSFILLLMLVSAGFGRPATQDSTMQLRLSTGANEPLAKASVQVWYERESHMPHLIGYPMDVQLTTDDSGAASLDLMPGNHKIHLETKNFEDYTFEFSVKPGETRTVEVHLNPVEEFSLVRLPPEQKQQFAEACKRPEFPYAQAPASFENAQQWAELWSTYKLEAPKVDFKKWRVLFFISRRSEGQAQRWIRRVTYDPQAKIIRARTNYVVASPDAYRVQVFTCVVDFLLIPSRPGHAEFRYSVFSDLKMRIR